MQTSPAKARMWRRLLFLLSAVPLGVLALALLVTGWTLSLVFSITPLVVPLLVGLAFCVRLVAVAEGYLARELLGVAVTLPRRAPVQGFWRRGADVLADGAFWRQQGYLSLRVLVGWPLAILQLALLGAGLFLLVLPLTYRWLEVDVVGRRVDTFLEALAFAPVGAPALVAAFLLVRPLALLWRPLAAHLLGGAQGPARTPAENVALRRRLLRIYAAGIACVGLLLTGLWVLTTPSGYFWPAQAILPALLALGITAWTFLVLERREIETWTGGSRALALQLGFSAMLWLYLVLQWLFGGRGYFWPGWVLLALGLVAAVHAGVVFARREHRRTHRIEELEVTRAGAVDVQESELRRIERDLHDGAQARLVALGLHIGMAEDKLASDPESAKQLLAEARSGAREALEELRDLARGIHPPILADRGLDAAIRALGARTPLQVDVHVDLAERPRPAVETAAYFVVAEALANAGKHAGAARVGIRVLEANGTLVAEVADDGRGGADPAGSGLTGLRRRVEALDGTLRVTSPAGGPTTVTAELPCAS
jgi:signal transduction histidine kinase